MAFEPHMNHWFVHFYLKIPVSQNWIWHVLCMRHVGFLIYLFYEPIIKHGGGGNIPELGPWSHRLRQYISEWNTDSLQWMTQGRYSNYSSISVEFALLFSMATELLLYVKMLLLFCSDKITFSAQLRFGFWYDMIYELELWLVLEVIGVPALMIHRSQSTFRYAELRYWHREHLCS